MNSIILSDVVQNEPGGPNKAAEGFLTPDRMLAKGLYKSGSCSGSTWLPLPEEFSRLFFKVRGQEILKGV